MLTWLFLCGMILGCLGSIALLWVSLAHAVGAIVLSFLPRKIRTPRVLMRGSMALIVCALLYWTSVTPYHLSKLIEARNNYPIEDISSRLDYEDRIYGSDLEKNRQWDWSLAPAVESRMMTKDTESQESLNFYGRRIDQLRRVHEKKYERFVRQLGFGFARMPGIGYAIDTPELPTIDVDSALTAETDEEWTWVLHEGNDPRPVQLSKLGDFSNLHFASEGDFLNPNMFGYVTKTRPANVEVAGFVPHAFHDGLEVIKTSEYASLQLKKLELVSLTKFEKPKAYVLDHLPRMDDLSQDGIKTRDLNPFETRALQQLWSDKDVVYNQNSNQILMMGALRASTQCLDCHAGARGDLLGAFTYEFSVAGSVPTQ